MKVNPFSITEEDVAGGEPDKVRPVTKRPRFQALNDDMVWIAQEEIRRMKEVMHMRDGPLTDKEHARFIKTSEQLRKLRQTDAELNKANATGDMDDLDLDEEFFERCKDLDLDPDKVLEAFGLKDD